MSAGSLYLRCIGWGLATGASVGCGFGTLIGLAGGAGGGEIALAGIAALAGLFYGLAVAVIPTFLGGIAVVVMLSWRHPQPAVYEAVHHDLTIAFVAVVGLLDLVVLGCWAAVGGWASLPAVVAVLAAVDAVTALMLRFARISIARAWAGDPVADGVACLPPGSWNR